MNIKLIMAAAGVAIFLSGCEEFKTEDPVITSENSTSIAAVTGKVYSVDADDGKVVEFSLSKKSFFSDEYILTGNGKSISYYFAKIGDDKFLAQECALSDTAINVCNYSLVKIKDGVLYINAKTISISEFVKRGLYTYKKVVRSGGLETVLVRIANKKKILAVSGEIAESSEVSWVPYLYDEKGMKGEFPDLRKNSR